MAPGKPTPSNNFVAIVQVAQNPLKCAMLTLFVLKNAPFFQEGRRILTKLHENPPPPPPSLSVSKQRRISILESQTLCMCVVCYWREEVVVQECV